MTKASTSKPITQAEQKAAVTPADEQKPETEGATESASSDQAPQWLLRLKSERAPYRRGGMAFDQARQWFQFSDKEAEERFGTPGLKKLIEDPAVVVQASMDGGASWTDLVVPPEPIADEDDE